MDDEYFERRAAGPASRSGSLVVKLGACGLYLLGVLFAFTAWADPEKDPILPTALLVFALPLLLRALFPNIARWADRQE